MPYLASDTRYDNMTYNRTGNSGLKLPAISLGWWYNFGGRDNIENGRAIARRALGILQRRAPAAIHDMNRIFDSIHPRESLQPYPGRVTLFLATHGWGFDGASPDVGWRALCGDLDIIHVEGEHHTVIRDDVASLAKAFERALKNARA